jgi:hypothetical protein
VLEGVADGAQSCRAGSTDDATNSCDDDKLNVTLYHLGMHIKLATAILFVSVATCGLALPAQACIVMQPFDFAYIKHADAVFSGKLLQYRRVSPDGPGVLSEYGLLTVRVGEVFRGEVSDTVQLTWHNSTFGMPERMDRRGPLLFAATGPGRSDGTQDELLVLQQPCSDPFILPYSRENADEVRASLAGEAIELYGPGPTDAEEQGVSISAIPEEDQGEEAVPITILAAIGSSALIAFGALFFWRRRERPEQNP